MKKIYLLIVMLLAYQAGITQDVGSLNLRTTGIVLKVTDLNEAQKFYEEVIGFEVKQVFDNEIQLKSEGLELWLRLAKKKRDVKYGKETHAILTLHTNNLDSAIHVYKKKGVNFIREVLENGIGHSAPFRDPFGNVVSILEQDKFPVPYFQEPQVLNVGMYLPSIDESKDYYVNKLGFDVRTLNYLPKVLPLNHDNENSISIILHNKDTQPTNVNFKRDTQANILFSTYSIEASKKYFTNNGIIWLKTENKDEIAIQDPWGNYAIIKKI